MSDPTLNPTLSPNQYPFSPRPATETLAQYLALGNACECSPVKAPDHCPIHAYNTLGMNLRAVHPSELTGGVTLAQACIPTGGVVTNTVAPLFSDVKQLRIKHFPWIIPLVAVPLAAWLLQHFHLIHLHLR